MHHFYLLGSFDNVCEMASAVVLKVVLHFGTNNDQYFWEIVVPWAFGPLKLAGCLVFFAQQGRVAPVSFYKDLVDALHNFLVLRMLS